MAPTASANDHENQRPQLIVVVDTEEEFDWNKDFDRNQISVRHMTNIHRTQDICDDFGVTPVYVIDYPIASQESGYAPLKDYHDAGRAIIGAHLHPWVNPPFEEDITPRNSYPGNLPRALEAEKLSILAEQISKSIGRQPTIYKAGRYGRGPNTYDILREQGFDIDISPYPPMDLRRQNDGPNYTRHTTTPSLIGDNEFLLCLPNTGSFIGFLSRLGPAIFPIMDYPALQWAHLIGIASQLRMLERICLTPEKATLADMKRLTDFLLARGERVFVMSYHSPSVEPGHTPYVKDQRELTVFLDRIKGYFEYFFQDLNGIPTTPQAVKSSLDSAASRQTPQS